MHYIQIQISFGPVSSSPVLGLIEIVKGYGVILLRYTTDEMLSCTVFPQISAWALISNQGLKKGVVIKRRVLNQRECLFLSCVVLVGVEA